MINFAVVGYGHIGKRHSEMITRNPETKLVAICDILPKEELSIDANDVPFFRSIDEMLASDIQIDVVNICTPNGFHATQAIKALEAGKHVVIEKPIALTKADAEMIHSKSLEAKRQVFCVMQNRYSPPSVWLKDVVSKGLLGKIYFVKADCFWNRDERYYHKNTWHGSGSIDGGTLFTQFSHFIDIVYWLFGDIENVTGAFADFNHQQLTDFEDSGSVSFNFVNGGMGVINYSTAVWDKNFESTLTIIGENGTIKVAGQFMNEVVYCNVKNYEMPELLPSNPPNDYGLYKGSAQNHHLVIQNVVDTLKGEGNVSTNIFEGMKVVEFIEKIYAVRDNQWERYSEQK